MKKKQATTPETKPACQQGELHTVPLMYIIPCPWNPRTVDPASPDIAELAASMKEQGQLQPGVARRTSAGNYELLAGRRRFEALALAKIPTMLLIVSDLDDNAAKDVTVLENLQREDLTPLEEARGVQTLLDDGRTAKEIAGKMGKTPQWVLRRAQLTRLIPALVKRIEKGDIVSLAQMETLARLNPEQQKDATGKPDHWFANGGIIRWANEQTRKLAKAPWSLDDATLCPKDGACDTCVKRSSHQPGLFDDELDPEKLRADDTCLDAACFIRKTYATAQAKISELDKKGKPVLKISGAYTARGDGCVGSEHYTECRKSTPGAVTAYFMDTQYDGDRLGTKTYVVVTGKKAAAKAVPQGEAKEESKEPSTGDRLATLTLRRQAFALSALQEAVSVAPAPCPAWYTMPRLFRLVWRFGINFNWQDPVSGHLDTGATIISTDDFDAVMAKPPPLPEPAPAQDPELEVGDRREENNEPPPREKAPAFEHPLYRIWIGVRRALANTCGYGTQADITADRLAWAEACCTVIGHTWQDYLDRACEAIPMPKALAKQIGHEQIARGETPHDPGLTRKPPTSKLKRIA